MATMDDVARAAGVSITTVSHVLNGTRHVSERTRHNVEQAIADTGYRAHRLARSLASGRTQTIGLCISAMTNPYFGNLAHSIENALADAGYTLVLGDGHDDPQIEERTVRSLLDYRIDGMILAPTAHAADVTIPLVQAAGAGLVLIDRLLDIDVDQVASEGYAPARRLTEHLLELGHRKVAVLTGNEEASTSQDRFDGYRDALEAAGIDVDPRFVAVGGSNVEQSEAALGRVLDLADPPTALVSLNNSMTIGAMRAIRARSVDVPGDLAMVCYDDFEWANLFEPRLTAIAQDERVLGQQAVELLLDRLARPEVATRRVQIPTVLNHRNSCGCS